MIYVFRTSEITFKIIKFNFNIWTLYFLFVCNIKFELRLKRYSESYEALIEYVKDLKLDKVIKTLIAYIKYLIVMYQITRNLLQNYKFLIIFLFSSLLQTQYIQLIFSIA